jgi:hypothetical protein
MKKRVTSEMSRYAAMLLFQYRVIVGGKSSLMRTCEKRIIVLTAASARAALAAAKRRGSAAKFSYKNSDNNPVHFEFVGILDLLELGVECEADEVWYDIIKLKRPKERAKSILPPERKLNAIRWQGANKPLNARPRVKHAAH